MMRVRRFFSLNDSSENLPQELLSAARGRIPADPAVSVERRRHRLVRDHQ